VLSTSQRIVLKSEINLKEILNIAIKHIKYNNKKLIYCLKNHKNLILVPIERCSVV